MEGYHWLRPQLNWNHKKLAPHIWQKDHSITNISLVGPVDKFHKMTHKYILVLCNFDQCMDRDSSMGRIHGSSRMNLMSHKVFKFFKTTLFLELSRCIFTIKGGYSTYMCFAKESIEIQWVLTFSNNFWPFFFIKLANF
jgi:hypothetical protein